LIELANYVFVGYKMSKLLESAPTGEKQSTALINTENAGSVNDLPDSLIQTKLNRPCLPMDLVRRSRLTSRLQNRRERPLTLVSAPAGYGKTTLISCWLEAADYPATWISLDEGDNDVGIFLSYLVAAILKIFPNSMAETQALLLVTPLPPIAAIVNLLINELDQIETDFILVLDDFHFIGNKEIHELVSKILLHPPRNFHLVIGTRKDPIFPLTTLRASSKVTEIRIQDLRFNQDETQQFLNKIIDSPIDWDDVIEADTLVEGWVTGLRLTALAMRHRISEDYQQRKISANNQYVTEYLISEILAKQESRISECMKKISILDRFCADLCEEVCFSQRPPNENQSGKFKDQGKQFLEWLQASNLFVVPLDDQNKWFRFHHLFRLILQAELTRTLSADEINELHAAAGHWYAKNSYFEEALNHLLQANETAAAINLVSQQRSRMINADQWSRLERWLNRFPQQVIETSAELWLLKIWLVYHHGQWSDLPALLERLTTLLDLNPELMAAKNLTGEICSLRSLIAYHAGDAEGAISMARQALELLSDDFWSVRILARSYFGVGMLMSGDEQRAFNVFYDAFQEEKVQHNRFKATLLMTACYFHWISADLYGAAQAARQSIAFCPGTGYESILGYGKYNLGRVHYQQNELVEAEELFASVAAKPYQYYGDCFVSSACGLVLTYQAQGREAKAREVTTETIAFLMETGNTTQLPVALALQADLALRQGQLAAARQWAKSIDQIPPMFSMIGFINPHLTLIKVWLAQNTTASQVRAGKSIRELRQYLNRINHTRFLIETLALQAMLDDVTGDQSAALVSLEKALKLAQPWGFIRMFVDLGPQMAVLLSRLRMDQDLQEYVDHIRSAFVGSQGKGTALSLEEYPKPLTNRELQILELLGMRLTNKEIATQLVIAPGTVKAHTIRIYKKLAVKDRRQAVERAISLGILQPSTTLFLEYKSNFI
jgi:LuxR family maltose regulon positive regulatory protein